MTLPTRLRLIFYVQLAVQAAAAIISFSFARSVIKSMSNMTLLLCLSAVSIGLVIINLVDKAIIGHAYRVHEAHRDQIDDAAYNGGSKSQSVSVSRDEAMESQAPSRDEMTTTHNVNDSEDETAPLKSSVPDYGAIRGFG